MVAIRARLGPPLRATVSFCVTVCHRPRQLALHDSAGVDLRRSGRGDHRGQERSMDAHDGVSPRRMTSVATTSHSTGGRADQVLGLGFIWLCIPCREATPNRFD
jgi:hypothetical protein